MTFLPTEFDGGLLVRSGAPAIEEFRDVMFIPNTASAGRAWGIFDQRGNLVQETAFRRGAERTFVMQDAVTTVAFSEVKHTAPDETYIYGGAMHVHFGHFLLSTLSRFWPAMVQDRGSIKILMNVGEDPAVWFGLPHIAFAFGQLGLTPDDFVRFEAPTRVNRLIVPHTSVEEQHFAWTAYTELTHRIGRSVTARPSRRLSTPAYLAKTRLRSGVWRFDNEQAVIDILVRHGVDIVFPEQLTPAEQIELFHDRDLVCGSVGSALHAHVFTPEPPRIIAFNRDPQIISNFGLLDQVNAADASYYHHDRGYTVSEPQAGFSLNCRLNEPAQVAEDLLALLERARKVSPSMIDHAASPRSPSLDEVGLKYGTDKASEGHGFLGFYERFFRDLQDLSNLRIMEIGVYNGDSLRMWEEYFPHASIVGVDIDPRTLANATARTTIELADQSNIVDLTRLATTHGPFDIVLDDGSHHWDHQITSFRTLYPHIKPGGYYVLEDLDTSYGRYVPDYQKTGTISAAKYLHLFLDALVGDTALDLGQETDAFIRSYAPCTEFVAFHKRTAVIRRKAA